MTQRLNILLDPDTHTQTTCEESQQNWMRAWQDILLQMKGDKEFWRTASLGVSLWPDFDENGTILGFDMQVHPASATQVFGKNADNGHNRAQLKHVALRLEKLIATGFDGMALSTNTLLHCVRGLTFHTTWMNTIQDPEQPDRRATGHVVSLFVADLLWKVFANEIRTKEGRETIEHNNGGHGIHKIKNTSDPGNTLDEIFAGVTKHIKDSFDLLKKTRLVDDDRTTRPARLLLPGTAPESRIVTAQDDDNLCKLALLLEGRFTLDHQDIKMEVQEEFCLKNVCGDREWLDVENDTPKAFSKTQFQTAWRHLHQPDD